METKSKKKLKLGEDEAENIIFKGSVPTLQEILNKMEEGNSMACFKFLKYETRNDEEKRNIEDTLMTKLDKWKYSLDELAQNFFYKLTKEINHRWESAKKNAKDIFEQTLKQLMLILSKKEVNESLKKNEKKFTLKLNT